jgi:hypothetical protein
MVFGGGASRPGKHLTQTELSNISEGSKWSSTREGFQIEAKHSEERVR